TAPPDPRVRSRSSTPRHIWQIAIHSPLQLGDSCQPPICCVNLANYLILLASYLRRSDSVRLASAQSATSTVEWWITLSLIHPTGYWLRAARIARHTRSGVIGMAMSRTPSGPSASSTAPTSAAGAAIEPASPQPFAPSGL